MNVRWYLLTLFLMFFGLMTVPLSAQEENSSPNEFEETAADSDEVTDDGVDSKKKKKKKKKSKKGKKINQNSGEETDNSSEDESAKKDISDGSAVVEAFNKFKNVGGRLNQRAEHFIYLYSSSTCSNCQRCMPIAVAQYKKMKSRKVELIIISWDGSEDNAKKYLKSYRMKNPCIMFSALQATKLRGLPGCGMPGLPAVSVVDKDGKMLRSGIGAQQVIDILNDWKSITGGK